MYPESAGPRYSTFLTTFGKGRVLISTSRCYERQLRDGFLGHLHGYPAPLHSCGAKQEARSR